MILAQRPVVPRESMGERGSNYFFAQKFGKFIYLNQENPICDMLPRCYPPF